MAIAPIDIYQPQANPLQSTSMLGVNAISQILQQQLQVGRDNANNALAQERDFLAERARLDSLAQRKGEFATSTALSREKFGRDIYESDRNFLTQQSQFDQQQGRLASNDAFQQEQSRAASTRALGAEQRDIQRLDMQSADRNFDNAYKAEEFDLRKRTTEASLSQNQSQEAERLRREQAQRTFGESLLSNVAVANSSVVTPEGAQTAQEAAQQDYLGLTNVDPTFARDRPDILRAQVGLVPLGRATNAESTARESLQIRKDEIAKNDRIEALTPLVADSIAFKPPAGDDKISLKDKTQLEIGYALNAPSEEAYVAAGAAPTDKPLTASEIKARREFYRKATGGASGIAPTSAAPRNLLPSYLKPKP